MTSVTRLFAGLLLSGLLALASVTSAVARGQPTPVGTVVLCSGGAIVTVQVDAEGKPVSRMHLCPDFAMSVFVAVGGVEMLAAPQRLWRRLVSRREPLREAVRAAQTVRARGPPPSL